MTDYQKEYLYAQMANQAYNDRPKAPAGWQVVPGSTVNDKTTGFAATAFQNPVTKEIVIAYRGTNDLNDISRTMRFWESLATGIANSPKAWNMSKN